MDDQEASTTMPPIRYTSLEGVDVVSTSTECWTKLFTQCLKTPILYTQLRGCEEQLHHSLPSTPTTTTSMPNAIDSKCQATSLPCALAHFAVEADADVQCHMPHNGGYPRRSVTCATTVAHGFTPKPKNYRRHAPGPNAPHLRQGYCQICP
jgi:hypothetical protein